MFPLNSNMTYIKDTGERVRLGDIIGSGGGGGNTTLIEGETEPSNDEGNDGDIYLKILSYDDPPEGYDFIEYIATTTSGPYIATGVEQKIKSYFEVDLQYTNTSQGDTWIFGTGSGSNSNEIGCYSGQTYFYINNSGYQHSIDAARHVFKYAADGCFVDGNLVNQRIGVDWADVDYCIFARNNGTVNGFTPNAKIYSCKIYDDDTLIRNFVPVKEKTNNIIGLYDLVNNTFYDNDGTGSFTGGNVLSGDYVLDSYIKISGVWQPLNGSTLPT